MGEHEETTKARPSLNLAPALAAGLAALTSAVLLSTTGTTGTVAGAALGSVVVTLGNEIYEYYLRRVAELRALAFKRMTQRARVGKKLIVKEPEPVVGFKEVFRNLPWRRALMVTAGIFLVVMFMITSFEAAAGRSVSNFTGGSNASSTIPIPDQLQREPAVVEPQPGEQPASSPAPTVEEEVEEETPPASEPEFTPLEEPTEEESVVVTPVPTPTPTLTETPTPTSLDTTAIEPTPTVAEPTEEPTSEPTHTEPPESEATVLEEEPEPTPTS